MQVRKSAHPEDGNAAFQTHSAAAAAAHVASQVTSISAARQILFATMVGLLVINLFASQTLIGPIAAALHIAPRYQGLVAMLPQLGYAIGLFLLVPLADRWENRCLIASLAAICSLTLAAAGLAPSAWLFLLAITAAGSTTSAIQMLVPLAATMAAEHHRGKVVGNVMSGLMLGILLSRPLANLLLQAGGWRLLYAVLSATVGAATLILYVALPQRRPLSQASYSTLVSSLWHLLKTQPLLRLRGATAALSMAAFSAFWTAVALLLAQTPFGLTPSRIALFALAGAAGAVIAPLAGRAGDRGWSHGATIASHLSIIGALALAGIGGAGWLGFSPQSNPILAIGMLAAAAIWLDSGVTGDQTLGRRAVNLLPAEFRSRLNGLFVGIFFIGGAIGASGAALAWTWAGWSTVCWMGMSFAALALMLHLLSVRPKSI
jgi:predicted MFS family arabinose efflux permease